MKKIFLISVIISLALCGCAKNNSQPTSDNTKSVKETLNLFNYTPDTFNPIYTKSKTNLEILNIIYEPLVYCDDSLNVQKCLAENYIAEKDATLWTITIKSGIKWHDGTPLTAKDVESTFHSIINDGSKNHFYYNLSNIRLIETDGNKIIFNLNNPQTNFINLLNIPIVKSTDASKTDMKIPIGTGNYKYEKTENKIMTLIPNEYRSNENFNIKKINVTLIPDKTTSVYAFTSHITDVINTDLNSWSDYSTAGNTKSIEYSTRNFNFLRFNTENPHLENVEIRKAFYHALNKEKIKEEVLLSHGSIAESFINSSWWMYDEKIKKYDFNTQKSIDIFKKYFEKGKKPVFNLLLPDGDELKNATADIIISNLSDAGINLTKTMLPFNEYIEKINLGEYDLYLGEIIYSDDINPLYIYSNDNYVKIYSELQKQTSDEERKRYYTRLQKRYNDDLYIIPLFFDASAVLCNESIIDTATPLNSNIYHNINNWTLKNSNE